MVNEAGRVKRRGILWDVMSTLVHDPIFTAGPRVFGCPVRELFGRLSGQAWIDFELGAIDEATYFQRWIKAGPAPDPTTFLAEMNADYAWLPGVEALLAELQAQGVPMHVLSNYPPWWRRIEARLGVSRYVQWTAVSCEVGLRKPDPAVYHEAARRAGLAPAELVFVDDRAGNVEAARGIGMAGVVFEGAAALRAELARQMELDL